MSQIILEEEKKNYLQSKRWLKFFPRLDIITLQALLISEYNFIFFLSFFFHFDCLDFQKELAEALASNDIMRLLAVIPRGHGKSTVVEAYVIWCVVFNPGMNIIYGSATEKQALEHTQSVLNKIAHIKPFKYLVPKGKNRFWSRYLMVLANGAAIKATAIKIQLAGTKRTGGLNELETILTELDKRPDKVILDDISPQSSTDSIKDYMVIEWLQATIFNIGNLTTKLVLVGTPYRETDAPNFFKKNKLFSGERGKFIIKSVLRGKPIEALWDDTTETLDPVRFPLWHLRELYEGEGSIIFAQQLMCEYVTPEDSMIKLSTLLEQTDKELGFLSGMEDIEKELDKFIFTDDYIIEKYRTPERMNYLKKFVVKTMGLDLATASQGDYFSVTCLGYTKNNKMVPFFVFRKKGVPGPHQKRFIEILHLICKFDKVVIEANAYQIVLGQFVNMESSFLVPVKQYETTGEKHDLQFGIPKIKTHAENGHFLFPYLEGKAKHYMDDTLFYHLVRIQRNEEGKVESIITGSHIADEIMSFFFSIDGLEEIILRKPRTSTKGGFGATKKNGLYD